MIPEIDKFRSLFKDFARPNRFKIQFFNTPVSNEIITKIEELAKNISEFPSFELANTKFKRMGKNFTILNELQNENNITIEFFTDEGLTPLRFYKEWVNKVITDFPNNINQPDFESDGAELHVIQYNIDLKQQLGIFKFYNVKPISISGITFNHDTDSDITNSSITFSFTDLDFEKV